MGRIASESRKEIRHGLGRGNRFSVACSYTDNSYIISRVPDQNGASLLYIVLEIHHSGWTIDMFVFLLVA